jgi:hypothetical protein
VDPEDRIDPQLFLQWQGSFPTRERPAAADGAEAVQLTGTNGRRHRYSVIPVENGALIRWLDPAGFELARSENILGEFPTRRTSNDYELRIDSKETAVHRTFSAASRNRDQLKASICSRKEKDYGAVTNSHPRRQPGRMFPHSRYDDPDGDGLSGLNATSCAIGLPASLYGGALRFVVLDDVTSSFDAGHQHHLVEVIRARCCGGRSAFEPVSAEMQPVWTCRKATAPVTLSSPPCLSRRDSGRVPCMARCSRCRHCARLRARTIPVLRSQSGPASHRARDGAAPMQRIRRSRVRTNLMLEPVSQETRPVFKHSFMQISATRARQIGRQNTPAQETAPAALQLTAYRDERPPRLRPRGQVRFPAPSGP